MRVSLRLLKTDEKVINYMYRKLSAEDVLSIIKEYTKGIRIVDLAKKYKVGRMTITTILDRKLYKEVKVPKLAEQLLLKQRINN